MHYNGDNSYLFVKGKKVTQFIAKNCEIKAKPMYLGTLTIANRFNTTGLSAKDFNDIELCGNVYDFSVDYSAISNDEILKIHKYLMKKNGVII